MRRCLSISIQLRCNSCKRCHLSLESSSIPANPTDGVTVTDVADVDENESNPDHSIEQAFLLSNV